MPSVVLTQPTGNAGNIPGLSSTDIAVPFNTTTTLDQCECVAVRWFYVITDDTDNTRAAGEVHAHKIGSSLRWNWHSIIGDINTMVHTITVQTSTSPDSIDLIIFNNDAGGQDWTADVVRIQTR